MHAKPDLRVFLKWMIAGSGSVIVAVMSLGDSLDKELVFHSRNRILVRCL